MWNEIVPSSVFRSISEIALCLPNPVLYVLAKIECYGMESREKENKSCCVNHIKEGKLIYETDFFLMMVLGKELH